MPANPEWLVRLPAIRAQLESLEAPVVDRAVLEQVFGVSRRRAIQLMHQFSGYQAGRTFLIDRARLVAQLAALESGADFVQQEHRREKLGAEMDSLRRAQAGRYVRIPVNEQVLSSTMAHLPSGVALHSGRLLIEFDRTEDLLVKLFALSQAAAHDFDAFTTATTAGSPGSRPQRAAN